LLKASESLSRHFGLAAFGVGLLIAVTLVAVHRTPAVHETHQRSSQLPYGLAPVPGKGPFAGEGEDQVSLAEAASSAPYHLYRPDDLSASDKSTTAIWTARLGAGDNSEFNVAIEYESGVELLVKPVELNDPAAAYDNIVKQGGFGYTRDIEGSPAMVIPQNSDGTGSNPGSVDMVIKGIEVSIVAHMSEEDLLRIAESVS
jgi:hypothetical protein